MSEPLAHYEVQHSAAIIALNRPDRRNALSQALISALLDAFSRARDRSLVHLAGRQAGNFSGIAAPNVRPREHSLYAGAQVCTILGDEANGLRFLKDIG